MGKLVGRDGEVPLAVPVVGVDGEFGELLVTDLDTGRVVAGVESGLDTEPGPGGARSDQVDDDLV